METVTTRVVGQYFTYCGVKAYKFTYNKFVTEEGKIFTLYKSREPKEVCMTPNGQGYRIIKYREETYSTTIHTSVHQVVARAFIDNPNNYEVVDHINENKEDNRVTNLRWTTLKGNNNYYNFKGNREIEVLKEKNLELIRQNKELNSILRDIRKEREKLIAAKNDLLHTLEEALNKAEDKFNSLVSRNIPKDKYAQIVTETKGKTFGSVESMIQAVGKEIKVNGVTFNTIREASRYITEQPDCTANIDTVRKEIRKLVRGERAPWTYLGKYYIST